MAPEVLVPSSEAEAVSFFGDGAGTTVIGGGTVVVPEITYGRLDPGRVLLLSQADLDGISIDGQKVTIGATTRVDELLGLADHVPALAACAENLADYEIRGQATVGGNLCTAHGADSPRGDLQGALLALDATVRSAGADGERTEPLEDFLANRHARLVLEVSSTCRRRRRSRSSRIRHTHEYTVLAVTGARAADGTIRLAATGLAGPAHACAPPRRLPATSRRPGRQRWSDVTLADDALASSWYRQQTLPVLVRRVLTQLEESA